MGKVFWLVVLLLPALLFSDQKNITNEESKVKPSVLTAKKPIKLDQVSVYLLGIRNNSELFGDVGVPVSSDLAIVRVDATSSELRDRLNKPENVRIKLLDVINSVGIFLADWEGDLLTGWTQEMTSQGREKKAWTVSYEVLGDGYLYRIEFCANSWAGLPNVYVFNGRKGCLENITCSIKDRNTNVISCIEHDSFKAIHKENGMPSLEAADSIFDYFEKTLGVGIAVNGKIIESFVQYLSIRNEKTGQRGGR